VSGDGPTAVRGWVWNDWRFGAGAPQNLAVNSLLWSQKPTNFNA
jgi:hypothetical protein